MWPTTCYSWVLADASHKTNTLFYQYRNGKMMINSCCLDAIELIRYFRVCSVVPPVGGDNVLKKIFVTKTSIFHFLPRGSKDFSNHVLTSKPWLYLVNRYIFPSTINKTIVALRTTFSIHSKPLWTFWYFRADWRCCKWLCMIFWVFVVFTSGYVRKFKR